VATHLVAGLSDWLDFALGGGLVMAVTDGPLGAILVKELQDRPLAFQGPVEHECLAIPRDLDRVFSRVVLEFCRC
jgi:hypothetical protein